MRMGVFLPQIFLLLLLLLFRLSGEEGRFFSLQLFLHNTYPSSSSSVVSAATAAVIAGFLLCMLS